VVTRMIGRFGRFRGSGAGGGIESGMGFGEEMGQFASVHDE